MARYEHLPIYLEAYDLTVHIEKIVRNFSRYHKYTLGTDLRNKTRAVYTALIIVLARWVYFVGANTRFAPTIA
jgi:hypothetical protein